MKIIKENMNFGYAFEMLKENKNNLGMRLQNWSEDVVIKIQYPDEYSKMTTPYLYVESRYGRVPWKETVVEMFSNKWQVVEVED